MEHILKQHGLRVTEARLIVLETFLRTGQVHSPHSLLAACGRRVDRVTLYRTLHVFLLHELVYKVPSSTGVMQYGLRKLGSEHHIHLVCSVCGVITSLDGSPASLIALPPGFTAESMEVIVGGVCTDCLTHASGPRQAARRRPGQTPPRL